MIVSYIQKHSESARRPPTQEGGESELDLGQLLLGFLKFYGFEFDYENKGISVLEDGSYFSKQERGWFVLDKPYLLALEDPCDTENDVGKSAFNITAVIMLFQQAYDQLVLPERYPHISFLTRIMDVPPNVQTVRRNQSAPFRTKSSKKYKKRREGKQNGKGSTTTNGGSSAETTEPKGDTASSTATTTTTTSATATTTNTPSDEDTSDTSSSLRSSKGDDFSGNELDRSDNTPQLEGDSPVTKTTTSSTTTVTETESRT